MPDRFRGKVAVVTGSGRGIGEAFARALAAEGAAVVVAEIDEELGTSVVETIREEGGEACFVRTDVAEERSARQMAGAAAEAYGTIDHLINNAAIFHSMRQDPLLSVDMNYYERFMAVNQLGVLHCVRAVHSVMRSAGGGSIVNVSSTAAWTFGGFYGISKLAVNAITLCLARELGPGNVRINALAPGPVGTEATLSTISPAHLEKTVESMCLGRMGQVQDMVEPCLFLLSDAAAFITGHILQVDGGLFLRA